jgi:hypothetical protein
LAPRKTAEQVVPDRPAHIAVFALRASFTSIKACLGTQQRSPRGVGPSIIWP